MPYLSPSIYNLVQRVVVGDFSDTYQLFKRLMGFRKGDIVVDVGCGTALIAPRFVEDGVHYVGLDVDEVRVREARKQTPGATFVVGDVRDPAIARALDLGFVIMHGVLHHLPDEEAREILRALEKTGCRTFAALEPERPRDGSWNALGWLYCRLDDGDHIRTREEYSKLFDQGVELTWHRFRRLVLPVSSLVAVAKFSEPA